MKPIEEIRASFQLIHRVATGQSDRAYMSIPARPEHDADLIVSAALDELEELRAQAEPSALHEASLAVHGALGWGFDPMTVSPVSLARAADELAKEHLALQAALARAQELQRGAEAQHCAALARVGELEDARTAWRNDALAFQGEWAEAAEQRDAAEAKLAKAREALTKYGDHASECSAGTDEQGRPCGCDCGFSSALSDTGEKP